MSRTQKHPLIFAGFAQLNPPTLIGWNFGTLDCDCPHHDLEKNDPIVSIRKITDDYPRWLLPGVVSIDIPDENPCGCNHSWLLSELAQMSIGSDWRG